MEQAGYEAAELNNIYADPLLTDPAGDDFHLLPGSPAIDAGDNLVLPADLSDLDGDMDFAEVLPWDFDGNIRCLDDINTVDSGNSQAPFVDIGVDELAHQLGLSIRFQTPDRWL